MRPWTGVVLALTEPGADGLRSRLSTYLHPLAGRPLAWHTVHALTTLQPPPERVVVVAGPDLPPDIFHDVAAEVRMVTREQARREEAFAGLVAEPYALVVDAAAPALGPTLDALLHCNATRLMESPRGALAAAWVETALVPRLVAGGGLETVRTLIPDAPCECDPDAVVVRDRGALARAGARVRDRVVGALMEAGTTFLLPDTVLVDVDVRIGRDAVVYPGVVLEGQTTIGDEAVIGPGCRVISSWIGRGAELKGFNYVSHTTVRNRAILEAYVRRGFD
jgi:bifunctional N-acetylglucosamine-1-phosphate-uridyltransferase/glucosamine-1-phosphate-acetyltransferase GlmU-like protein